MATKQAYQFDSAGLLVGPTEADESPLEENVFLLPAGCTFTPPPDDIPHGKWPCWRYGEWGFIALPEPEPDVEPAIGDDEDVSPLAKLQTFLLANPDVATLLTAEGALPALTVANEPT
jgi:hypothetical protein